MSVTRTVVVGGSLAGVSVARELRRGGYDGVLEVVESESAAPYRRPEVSKGLLSGKITAQTVRQPWPTGLGIDRFDEAFAEHVVVDEQRLLVRRGGAVVSHPYDSLVIATGSSARAVPTEWLGDHDRTAADLGVHTLRGVDDAVAFRARLARARHVVVVGGGFIGLEAAAVASLAGARVTVLEAAERLLARVLDAATSTRLLRLHAEHGVQVRFGASVARIEPAAGPVGNTARIVLADGSTVEADATLVAIGSTPAVGWLKASGLPVVDGLLCDPTCQVDGVAGVFAAGDVASWENPRYGRPMRVEHWTNAIEQGSYVARRILGTHDPSGFSSVPYFWSDQYDSRLQSVGSAWGHDAATVVRDDDRYCVVYSERGVAVAATGIGIGPAIFAARRLIDQRASPNQVASAVESALDRRP